jgi:microcystin-dependent protein
MSQKSLGTINPASESGNDLANNLSDFGAAWETMHSGSTAPSYAVVGLLWLDTSASPYKVKVCRSIGPATWTTIAQLDGLADPTWYGNAAGTANAITLSATTFTPSALYNGFEITFRATAAITTAATVTVGSLTTKSLLTASASALVANQIVSGQTVKAIYNSTADGFLIVSPLAADSTFPSGVMVPYAGSSAPTGWLLCFGQAVSRSTYAALFTAIGTTYGAGDGSTTFNLPDARGRVIAGKDDMGGSAASRLNTSLTGTSTAGNAVITGLSSTAGLSVGMSVAGSTIPSGRTIASIDSATQVTLNSGTSVTAGTVTLRFGVVDGATLGASGGAHTHKLTSAQMPLHGHPFRQSTEVGGITFDSTGGWPMSNVSNVDQPAYTGATTGTPGQQIGGAGGDQSHPNIQPTLVQNYIIKT